MTPDMNGPQGEKPGEVSYPSDVLFELQRPAPRQLPDSQKTGPAARQIRRLSWACVALGGALLAMTGYAYWYPAPGQFGLVFIIAIFEAVMLLALFSLAGPGSAASFYRWGAPGWGRVLRCELVPTRAQHGQTISWRYECEVEVEDWQTGAKRRVTVRSREATKGLIEKYDAGLAVGDRRLVLSKSKGKDPHRFYHLLGIDERMTRRKPIAPATPGRRARIAVLSLVHLGSVAVAFLSFNYFSASIGNRYHDFLKAAPFAAAFFAFEMWLYRWSKLGLFAGKKLDVVLSLEAAKLILLEIVLAVFVGYAIFGALERSLPGLPSQAGTVTIRQILQHKGNPSSIAVELNPGREQKNLPYRFFERYSPQPGQRFQLRIHEGRLGSRWIEEDEIVPLPDQHS